MTTTEVATLVDSNVLLDVIRTDPVWSSWSGEALARVADDGPVVINSIIYAEVSATYATVEEADALLASPAFVRAEVPWPAAFLAGRCHVEYRGRGGTRARTLPDFFIGAHAAVLGIRLLTRDPSRYRTYFPSIELIAPVTGRWLVASRSRCHTEENELL